MRTTWILWNFTCTFLLLLLWRVQCDVTQVGSFVLESDKGINVPGISFLLDDPMPAHGYITAITTYYRNENEAVFQHWRPLNASSLTMELVNMITVTPADRHEIEMIMWNRWTFAGDDCLEVEEGDRIGIFINQTPSAITYEWDFQSSAVSFHSVTNPKEYATIGDVVQFDALPFPFMFTAIVDVEIGELGPNGVWLLPPCEDVYVLPPTTIPPTTTVRTTTPIVLPSGPPGPIGPPGPPGQNGTDGANGLPGPPGPQGDIGPPGATGAPGPTGSPGQKGELGEPGADGADGAQGDAGPAGPPGDTGPTGQQGPKGDRGDQGDVGPRGPPGFNGTDGMNGLPGAEGPAGPQGDPGSPGLPGNGEKGDVGPPGPVGPSGPTGPQGPAGDTGSTGPPGEKGDRGDPGVTGAPGPLGPEGPMGPMGPAGSSSNFSANVMAGAATDGDSYFHLTEGGLAILILWLLVLTVAVLVACVMRLKRQKAKQARVNMPFQQDASRPSVINLFDEGGTQNPAYKYNNGTSRRSTGSLFEENITLHKDCHDVDWARRDTLVEPLNIEDTSRPSTGLVSSRVIYDSPVPQLTVQDTSSPNNRPVPLSVEERNANDQYSPRPRPVPSSRSGTQSGGNSELNTSDSLTFVSDSLTLEDFSNSPSPDPIFGSAPLSPPATARSYRPGTVVSLSHIAGNVPATPRTAANSRPGTAQPVPPGTARGARPGTAQPSRPGTTVSLSHIHGNVPSTPRGAANGRPPSAVPSGAPTAPVPDQENTNIDMLVLEDYSNPTSPVPSLSPPPTGRPPTGQSRPGTAQPSRPGTAQPTRPAGAQHAQQNTGPTPGTVVSVGVPVSPPEVPPRPSDTAVHNNKTSNVPNSSETGSTNGSRPGAHNNRHGMGGHFGQTAEYNRPPSGLKYNFHPESPAPPTPPPSARGKAPDLQPQPAPNPSGPRSTASIKAIYSAVKAEAPTPEPEPEPEEPPTPRKRRPLSARREGPVTTKPPSKRRPSSARTRTEIQSSVIPEDSKC